MQQWGCGMGSDCADTCNGLKEVCLWAGWVGGARTHGWVGDGMMGMMCAQLVLFW
jgi:hypothetical protein